MNLPKFPLTSANERIGVMRVATVLTEMGLIFRETSNSDTGIDGYIEEVNTNQEATGRMLAVQIKSGTSYLHDHEEYYIYYSDESHIKYWKLYPIPVILCVHNPETGITYYQTIKSHGHEVSTKVMIPKKQVLSFDNREDIFASIAGFSSSYHTTEELYSIMTSTKIAVPNSYVSFLDLFVGGLTNLCTDLFCDTSVLSNLIDLRTKQPMFHIEQQDHDFKAEKNSLGKVANEADKAMMMQTVREIDVKVAEERMKEAAKAKRKAERERKEYLLTLTKSEPFCESRKWGLKHEGRIVVPPIYRSVHTPVGRYCAVEAYPGIWGVIAVDGKMEIEPKYEKVEIRPDGTVELTVFNGKTVVKKLP